MKVNFKGETINLKNELKSRTEFKCKWEMYTIEVERWTDEKLWSYFIYSDKMDCSQGDEVSTKEYTMTQVLQLCFDMIDENIKETEEDLKKTLDNLNKLCKYRELKCPYCGSHKIFQFRLDSDWAYGSGDYNHINDDKYYTEEELNYDSFDRPDIEVYHCGDCGHLFD